MRILLTTILLLLVTSSLTAQLPDHEAWGRTRFRATAANPLFATADGCAHCHSTSPQATAMTSATGNDISPHGLWGATMMANSMRDPYFRAQLARETLTYPDRAAEIEGLCITCHAPMARHTADAAGFAPPRVAELENHALAQDGVSCTACHTALPDGLGTPTTWGGRLKIGRERVIFGPYEDPVTGPMTVNTNFTPTHGEHLSSSGFCGSCHTLETRPAEDQPLFLEQAPFLEWKNSEFAENETSCQDCHMPDVGPTRIARNPPGRDFLIPTRSPYRGHQFVGGNAWMLEQLAEHREALNVPATAAALERAARATRKQLFERTARLEILAAKRNDGELSFDVRIENLTGHKLPTGYPSRRMWLNVDVYAGRQVVFSSGAVDDEGRIKGLAEPLLQPHRDRITAPSEVPIYEAVADDLEGNPTTSLIAMARHRKDNRLLPRGWKADGPWAEKTAPVGIGEDADFTAGFDSVHYRIPVPSEAGRLRVIARLRYQTIPPAWVAGLRGYDASEEVSRFLSIYDASPHASDLLAIGSDFVD